MSWPFFIRSLLRRLSLSLDLCSFARFAISISGNHRYERYMAICTSKSV